MTAESIDNEITIALPEPADVAREPKPKGIPLKAGGVVWLLADAGLATVLNEQRDELFDGLTLHQEVGMRAIKHSAWVMLSVNYKLKAEDAIRVIEQFDRQELITAVLKGIFVHEATPERQSYTAWARSSLLANNIEPTKIARDDLPHVLRQLVDTKRAIPLEEFTTAASHAAIVAELMRVD